MNKSNKSQSMRFSFCDKSLFNSHENEYQKEKRMNIREKKKRQCAIGEIVVMLAKLVRKIPRLEDYLLLHLENFSLIKRITFYAT